MPTARFFKLPSEKQALVLDVAQSEFAGHGYEKASLNQIISGCGLSKGAIYYYFDNKADLFMTVVIRIMSDLPNIFEKIHEATDPDSFWSGMYDMYMHGLQFKTDPKIFGILRLLIDPKISSMFPGYISEMMQFSTSTMTRIFATGVRVGALRQDMPIHLMVHLIQGIQMSFGSWMMEQMQHGHDLPLEGLTEVFIGFMRSFFSRSSEFSGSAASFFLPFFSTEKETETGCDRPEDWTNQLKLSYRTTRGPQGA